jgi:hypothetical protein
MASASQKLWVCIWVCIEFIMAVSLYLRGGVAVREGFEPSKPFGLHTFQACSFGRSDTSPYTSYSDPLQPHITLPKIEIAGENRAQL